MISWSKSNFSFLKLSTLIMHHMISRSIILCSISLLFFGNVFGSELIIHEKGFSAAQKLGVLKVIRNRRGYAVLTDKGFHKVHNHDIDASLKKMSHEQLAAFLNEGNGTIRVTQFNNGEFNLKTHVYGNGGGPLFGSLLYALTKVACYGTAAAATGAIVVSTGGIAGAATGVAAASTTLGAGSAVTLTAAAISGAGGTMLAAEATTAVIATTGSLAGATALIEAASVAAYGVGTLVWFLP